jgi:tRNA dimethylallyltransferase
MVSRGKLPILVGGTGLYVSSLLDGLRFVGEKTDPALRAALLEEAEAVGKEEMLRRLSEIDPEYAKNLHPNNLGRVLRAIELYRSTGVTMTEQLRRSREIPSEFDPIMVGIDYADRQTLYDRINLRVSLMAKRGLVEEARAFYERYPQQGTAAQAIGCKELLPYLAGEEPLEPCLDRLRMETRRYAKRQRTWFRRDERVKWFYPDACSPNGLIQDVLDYIREQAPEL